jgi:hypothetical protein
MKAKRLISKDLRKKLRARRQELLRIKQKTLKEKTCDVQCVPGGCLGVT